MEPNRFHMAELLRDGPLTVGQIAERLALRQPQVSKHLKILSEAAIAEVQPQANRRIYQLRREPFQELETWLQSFRRLWDERFDRLDDYVSELQESSQHTSNRIEDSKENIMGKVMLGLSVSMDGFIADKNDDVSEVFAWMGKAMERFHLVPRREIRPTRVLPIQVPARNGWKCVRHTVSTTSTERRSC